MKRSVVFAYLLVLLFFVDSTSWAMEPMEEDPPAHRDSVVERPKISSNPYWTVVNNSPHSPVPMEDFWKTVHDVRTESPSGVTTHSPMLEDEDIDVTEEKMRLVEEVLTRHRVADITKLVYAYAFFSVFRRVGELEKNYATALQEVMDRNLTNYLDLDAIGMDGHTALTRALSMREPEYAIASRLLELGASPIAQNRRQQISLMFLFGRSPQAQLLLQQILDDIKEKDDLGFLNRADAEGKTVSHYAALKGTLAQLTALFALPFDFEPKTDNDGKFPADYSVWKKNKQLIVSKSKAALQRKIEAACQTGGVNQMDEKGMTLLHHAVRYGTVAQVSALCDHGALSMPDGTGIRPIDYVHARGEDVATTTKMRQLLRRPLRLQPPMMPRVQ